VSCALKVGEALFVEQRMLKSLLVAFEMIFSWVVLRPTEGIVFYLVWWDDI